MDYWNAVGKPSIDMSKCRGCGVCVDVCKVSLEMKDGKPQVIEDSPHPCVACGQCVAACPTGAMTVAGRGMTAEDSLPIPKRSDRADAAGLEALLLSRRSVRDYTKDDVPKGVVDDILRIASTAPMGFPPSAVEVTVIANREKTRQFSKDLLETMDRGVRALGNPVVFPMLRLFMNKADYEALKFVMPMMRQMVERYRNNGEDWLVYDAPLIMIFSKSPYADAADPVIAATYAMIAAESMGLGACMNGMVGAFLARDKKMKAKYRMPKDTKPIITLTIGYPAVKYHRALRRRFGEVVEV